MTNLICNTLVFVLPLMSKGVPEKIMFFNNACTTFACTCNTGRGKATSTVIFVDGFAKSAMHALIKTDFTREFLQVLIVETKTKLLQI